MNRILVEQFFLIYVKLAKIWAEVVNRADCRCSSRDIMIKSPEEIWYNKTTAEVIYESFRMVTMVCIPNQKLSILVRCKLFECIMLCYSDCSKAYSLYERHYIIFI